MSDPVVFISRMAIKEGMLEDFKRVSRDNAAALDAGKPETLVFLLYIDDGGSQLSIIHVFADAAAMDRHVAGAAERSRQAFQYLVPRGWEIYGEPSASVVDSLRASAAAAGVELRIYREFVSGFLHSLQGSRRQQPPDG